MMHHEAVEECKTNNDNLTHSNPINSNIINSKPINLNTFDRQILLQAEELLCQVSAAVSKYSGAYDEDDEIFEDEDVEKIITQGGLPPSQLSFLSTYASNQRLMNKLQSCNVLQLELTTVQNLVYVAIVVQL